MVNCMLLFFSEDREYPIRIVISRRGMKIESPAWIWRDILRSRNYYSRWHVAKRSKCSVGFLPIRHKVRNFFFLFCIYFVRGQISVCFLLFRTFHKGITSLPCTLHWQPSMGSRRSFQQLQLVINEDGRDIRDVFIRQAIGKQHSEGSLQEQWMV